MGGSTGGSQAPTPKSHPKVEGKIARSARLYKVLAMDPRCYEHMFVLGLEPDATTDSLDVSRLCARRSTSGLSFRASLRE